MSWFNRTLARPKMLKQRPKETIIKIISVKVRVDEAEITIAMARDIRKTLHLRYLTLQNKLMNSPMKDRIKAFTIVSRLRVIDLQQNSMPTINQWHTEKMECRLDRS